MNKSYHPLYGRWKALLHRCRSPESTSFERYGGRGISVCERWNKFENFLADMNPTFSPGLTIERIDNSKGYSKANCRWATYAEQARNTRNTALIDTPWGSLCLKDAASRAGMKWGTLRHRIHSGWPPDHWFDEVVNGGDRRSIAYSVSAPR
jgi:hypothetical protein